MKNIIIFLVISVGLLYADLSIAYIGFEEGQVMLGVESNRGQIDQNTGNEGDAGIDLRHYFRKNGIMVEAVEYGALEAKTALTLGVGGVAKEGNVLAYSNTLEFLNSEGNELNIRSHSIWETGYVKGANALTSFAPRSGGSSCH